MATIGFDARSVRSVSTGLGRVARCLLEKISERDTDNYYVVFQRKGLPEPLVSNVRFKTIRVGYDIASLRNQFLFSRILSKCGIDLYHSLNAFLPYAISPRIKSVITIHDFNWIQRPAISAPTPWRGYVNGLYGRFAHKYAVSRADRIVCVSDQTSTDLAQLYSFVDQPVATIHHGHQLNGSETAKIGALIRRLADRRYILSVGNGRAYKNPEGTVKAFCRIKAAPNNQDLLLVIVGRGDSTHYLRRLVAANGVGDSAVFLGMVTDADLHFLLENAMFLSFPSRWEGFGLPVVEAFAAGCPVLASTAGSLPEICGGAAYMIENPESTDEVSSAFDALLRSPTLRAQLKERGLQQAKRFSWDTAAKQYLAIYNSTLTN